MQNFGRGMWRRVGDYQRLNGQILLQQQRSEEIKKYIEYQKLLKLQQALKLYQEKLNNIDFNNKDNENVKSEIETINIEENVLDKVEELSNNENNIEDSKPKSNYKHPFMNLSKKSTNNNNTNNNNTNINKSNLRKI